MTKDINRIIDELHIYEKKVLNAFEQLGSRLSPEEVVESQKMDIKAVMSAAGSLESKGLITVDKKVDEVISLSSVGKLYAEQGLPERRMLKVLSENDALPMGEITKKASLDKSESKIAIGWLMKKRWAVIDKGTVKITEDGKKAIGKGEDDELLLDKLLETQKMMLFNPSKLVQRGYDLLVKRKGLIDVKKTTQHTLVITEKGMEILEVGIDLVDAATQLTHSQLKTGEWKSLQYRGYDIQAEYPEFYPGKMHPLRRIVEEIRDIFLNLGFTESRGPILESAFWNFDCLFQPQDHAAREMQDTFYIKNPQHTKLPETDLVTKVGQAHENGGKTGSEGWGYIWDEDVARQSVLRTHTTGVSARFLSENQPPLKMFSVGRVFRRETITYKHLPEFHQVEGIVAGDEVNFRNLLGILKEFYKKLGFEVRFRPAYFPYTYLSTECEIYLPEKESWIELGGAGMFRPEVLEPLGVETPVAAFGLGIERLAMIRLGIKDIRMLYKSDIGWLRKLPITQGVDLTD
ncbi:phenylalanine--tRNA ligase subunit alpha [Methanobacterium alcaliphilum]|uniref:phenylalanine--tRNA ligase subunit alpha n=1 Tax=Methanobacterium alcaliphilum TaxID=392018 RepID=UPI00200AEAEA|nr:phenylalanine--tRNA ligase subunit alpha [Methanobacterium alcaliphilum]MCK9150801.1 phenylalanine--tRNA ligase subunit alpha [Methanobacterium alcaliphilum]